MVGLWSIKKSKKPTIPTPLNSLNSRRYNEELISQLAPCSHYQEHHHLREMRRIRPVSTLADCMEVVSLREFTDNYPLQITQEASNVSLEAGINPALFGLHEDYSQSSLMTLETYASLKRLLQKEMGMQQAALKDLSDGREENYECRLNELRRRFGETCVHFTEEISAKFQAVYTQQIKTIERLQQGKKKFGKKLKFAKAWKKLSRAIFVSVFAAVIVCSVVAAVMASPPVSAAVTMATALPLGSLGKWIDSCLKKREQASKRKMEAVGAMLAGSRISIKDLDGINATIDELDLRIHSLLLNPESVITEEEGVQIMKMMEEFTTSLEELANQAERCRTSTKRASTIVLQRMTKTSS